MQISTAIMKRAALSFLLLLAFISPTFAILRPRYPVKAGPPYRGHFIVTGDDVLRPPMGNTTPAAPR
jgi:hypothetical protein